MEWFGHPVLECECGFMTPDKKEFEQHLLMKKHAPKAQIKKKQAAKPATVEEQNGLHE